MSIKRQHSEKEIEQLLRSYLDHSISNKGARVLERYAMDDPLLMDALEGYLLQDGGDPKASIDQLRDAIIAPPDKAVPSLFIGLTKWAAIVILIGSIIVVSRYFLHNSDQENIYVMDQEDRTVFSEKVEALSSNSTEKESADDATSPSISPNKTGASNATSSSKEKPSKPLQEELKATSIEETPVSADDQPESIEYQRRVDAMPVTESQVYGVQATNQSRSRSEKNRMKILSAMVLSAEGVPLEGAIVTIGDRSYYTNQQGYITVTIQDTIQSMDISYDGFETLHQEIKEEQSFYQISLEHSGK